MEKIIQLIKKLLGQSSSSDSSDNKGFTLIELLIVIAIIGILAAGLLIAIDPAEKIRAANDTTAIQQVSQTANKIEQYAVQTSDGVYPAADAGNTVPAAIGVPKAPTANYAYTYVVSGTNTFTLRVASLQSKKYSVTPGFIYDSAKGKTCSGAAGIAGC